LKYDEELGSGGGNHWHNELLASFSAGAIGAFLTNGIETVAVNK